jgi:hypothetical protein
MKRSTRGGTPVTQWWDTGDPVVGHPCPTEASLNISLNESVESLFTPHLSPTGIVEREIPTTALRRKQERSSAQFIRGPIPVQSVAAAGKLPGRALAVWLAVRYRVDITGLSAVTLPATTRAAFGLDRRAASRALRELELAGLVRVVRVKGRAAVIEAVPTPGASP